MEDHLLRIRCALQILHDLALSGLAAEGVTDGATDGATGPAETAAALQCALRILRVGFVAQPPAAACAGLSRSIVGGSSATRPHVIWNARCGRIVAERLPKRSTRWKRPAARAPAVGGRHPSHAQPSQSPLQNYPALPQSQILSPGAAMATASKRLSQDIKPTASRYQLGVATTPL